MEKTAEKSGDRPSETQRAETKPTETKTAEPRQVVAKRALIRWADIDWSEAKDADIHRVDFQDPPKPGLHAADDPLKNPFGDTRRPQSAKARLARVRGPNLGSPLLQPIADSKDAMPLPSLSPSDDKAAPRMLLNQPSGQDGLADDDQGGRPVPSIAEELAANPKAFMDKCHGFRSAGDRGPFPRPKFYSPAATFLSTTCTVKRVGLLRCCWLWKTTA